MSVDHAAMDPLLKKHKKKNNPLEMANKERKSCSVVVRVT